MNAQLFQNNMLQDFWSITPAPPDELWQACGCDACRNTGYRGRTGIFETVIIDGDLRAAIERATNRIKVYKDTH